MNNQIDNQVELNEEQSNNQSNEIKIKLEKIDNINNQLIDDNLLVINNKLINDEINIESNQELNKNINNLNKDDDKINNEVNIIKLNNSELKIDNNELKSDNNELKSDINELKSDNNELKTNNDENQIKEEIKVEEEEDESLKDDCENHVNFAIICSFFQQFGTQLGVNYSIETLKEMLENRKKIEDNLIELHVKLLRKIKKYVNKDRWENGLVKFLIEFSSFNDALELESNGYQKISLKLRIDLLKLLLEAQFDFNQKFKTEINNIETLLLRLVPIGRDLNGNQYWYHLDEEHTLRIYREKPNKNKDWKLICIDKDQFTQLIEEVETGKTEICDLSGERTLSENSDQEEEEELQLKQKNKSKKSKKGKNKSKQQSNTNKNNNSNKIVNGFKEEDNNYVNSEHKDLIVNNLKINEDNKQQLTPIKEERKGRRGRKPLNRSFISTPTLDRIKEEDDDNENSHSSSNKFDNVEEDIDVIVKQTIASLLNKIEVESNESSKKPDKQTELSINNQQQFNRELKIDNQNQKKRQEREEEEEIKAETKSRGRKKKNPLNELSKLLGDNAPKNLEDLMPIKRSSRIQKLQEKKSAELRLKMEIEQAKKMEEINKAKLTKKIIEQEQERNYQKTDDENTDEEEYEEPIKLRKNKNMDTSDTDNEFSSVKKKKKKGRKNRKEKEIKEKKSNKLKKWSSNDELDEFYQYEEEEEEVLKFDDNNDEFACEELEDDGEPVVLKRARTARKAKTDDNEEELDNECINDDTPCQKCSLYLNPEWILLCDNCNLGYHTDCLIPKLYLIPDGDWYCPKCENEQLLTKLRFEFENYVSNLAKREREQIRKERLKYVEINIGNILGEESANNRKRLSNKKKYEDYDSDLDDSDDLIDESDESDDDSNGRRRRRTRKRNYNDDSSDYDSDDSNSISNRKRNSYRRTNSNKKQANSRRSRPVQRISHKPKQRKRRLSYSDQTNSDEVSGSELSSQESNENSQSDSSSQPKQRSARKKVSYQFKEYDDLINSAIQGSDYDDYEENEEDEEDEEEDSDNGKSPYSKGKDMSNLMSASNPFETENNDDISMKTQIDNNELVVNNLSIDEKQKIEISPLLTTNTQQNEKTDEIGGDERKVLTSETKKKGKPKGKRKLNDLDSPVEEAENDSDFTIKEDESVTEIDDEDLESNDFSNETDLSDDTDLSDWARKSRKHNTRNSRSSNKKRNKKRRRRYDSDEESDYGYKTRRKSKRVTYRELSTTEEEEDFDDWSDNSEKQKKNKKNKSKKKKISDESDDLTNDLTDSQEDERTVLKKKKSSNKKIKKDYSDEEKDDFKSDEEEEEEEGKRKSKRMQKKKVYDDFTDIDESDVDDKQLDEKKEEIQDKEMKEQDAVKQDQQPQIDQSFEQQQILPQNSLAAETTDSNNAIVEQPPVIKRTPKIKVTKPNPNLIKNKNLNTQTLIDLPAATLPIEKINLPIIDFNNPNLPSNLIAQTNTQIDQQDIQLKNLNIPIVENTSEKKKRGRKPKDPNLKEVKDPNTPAAKRGRKPKTSLSSEQQIYSDPNQQTTSLNNPNKPSSIAANSALSQLTQFALDSSSKLLPNNPLVDPANIKHLLAAELANKNIPILNSQSQEMKPKQVKVSSKNKSINDLSSPPKTASKSSNNLSATPTTAQSTNVASSAAASTTVTKSNLNNSTHLLQNNLASVHFPSSTQPPNSSHLTNLTGPQHLINSGRQPAIPNHLQPPHPSMHQPQLPPNYALHGQNLHNLQAQHNLHNPYAPYPSPLAHQMANLPHHMQHSNPYALDPQFAANRFGFPPGLHNYPSSFYNPSFPYFSHPNQYNSYYNHPPQHPSVHQPPHQTPHLQTPTSQTPHQSTTASLFPATTNSIPVTVKSSSINTTQPNTTQSTNTTTTKTNNSSTSTKSQ